MASIASASPVSPLSFHRPDPTEDSDCSWQYVESDPSSSVGFIRSPASSSLNSWGLIGYSDHQLGASPVSMSSLHLDHDHTQHAPPPTSTPGSYGGQPDNSLVGSGSVDNQLMPGFAGQPLMTGQDLIFNEPFSSPVDITPYYSTFNNNIPDISPLQGLSMPQPLDLGIPPQFRDANDVAPWAPTNLKSDDVTSMMMMNEARNFIPQSPAQKSPGRNSEHESSSGSAQVKPEPVKSVSPIRKVRGHSKVEKKRSEPSSQFVIMTPNLINQQAGKPNPFECFEAMRATQRGRKGPLANEVKKSALQVRRLGACFCCHSRKVKCDKERPCKNCKKLTSQVPQIMCWQFGDFLPALFPNFIRSHFKKEEMANFLSDNVETFKINGLEQACPVELFSGPRFNSTLKIPVTFFTPKTTEILRHWHSIMGVNGIDLQPRHAAPLGVDPENTSQREELRKKTREYIQNLTKESSYAEQVTDAIKTTQLPRKVLGIVHRYAQRSGSAIVNRALSIYVMHYVLTRQLCLTHRAIVSLQATNMIPQNDPWVTSRVLNRQVKSMLDELLLKEMQALFDSFSKSLKPRSRKEWGPCLAAFLVLCLFMEAVELAADTFVISQNEITIHNRSKLEYRRDFALDVCKEIDNMPFKQFAYQFHQVYQTHSRDAATKPFNPLQDGSFGVEGTQLLDNATAEMVGDLQVLLEGDSWHELDFLVADPILPNEETHPSPRDVSFNYTGRLLARFLLSFTDEKYLFDGQY